MSTESILRVEEGKRLDLYPDSKGIWTIGIGYNIQRRGLPDDIVEELFRRDMAALRQEAAKIPEYTTRLDPVRAGVIERMVFQMGAAKVLKFVKFRAAVAREDWVAARAEMLDSDWQQDTPARCRREAERMLRGIE